MCVTLCVYVCVRVCVPLCCILIMTDFYMLSFLLRLFIITVFGDVCSIYFQSFVRRFDHILSGYGALCIIIIITY